MQYESKHQYHDRRQSYRYIVSMVVAIKKQRCQSFMILGRDVTSIYGRGAKLEFTYGTVHVTSRLLVQLVLY